MLRIVNDRQVSFCNHPPLIPERDMHLELWKAFRGDISQYGALCVIKMANHEDGFINVKSGLNFESPIKIMGFEAALSIENLFSRQKS